MQTAVNTYQTNQLATASRERILLLLFDGAINFTKIAREKLAQGDIAGKGIYIGKVQAIVAELMNTLNHEVGGELAGRLEQLYAYLSLELTNANLGNKDAALANTLKILVEIRTGFDEAIKSLAGGSPARG